MGGHQPPSKEEENILLETYPHFLTYKKCQSQGFATATVSMFAASACIYVVMNHWYTKFKPNIGKNLLIAGPIIGGALVAFRVAKSTSADCTKMWLAMEERDSAITPAEERQRMRMEELQSEG